MPPGQRTRGNLTDKVDRDLLHEYLWKKSDHNGRITISQTELAERLSINRYTMSTIYREMIMAGRIRRTGAQFFVIDPAIWRWNNPAPITPTLWNP